MNKTEWIRGFQTVPLSLLKVEDILWQDMGKKSKKLFQNS